MTTVQPTKLVDEPHSAEDTAPRSLQKTKRQLKADWQQRLLPLMSSMVIGLSLFFFLASFAQLIYLHTSILSSPEARPGIDFLTNAAHKTSADMRAAAQIQIAANLEAYLLDRRYHQANVLLMSRVWLSYLGFVTGMILALVGAVFILGKLSEPRSEASLQTSAFQLAMNSTSPGLVLTFLGVVLMLTTIIVHHEINVVDRQVYPYTQDLSVAAESATVQEQQPLLDPIPAETQTATESAVEPEKQNREE